jgi:hypothetical protein
VNFYRIYKAVTEATKYFLQLALTGDRTKYVPSSTLIISDVLEVYYLDITKSIIFSNIVPIPFVLGMYWMYIGKWRFDLEEV